MSKKMMFDPAMPHWLWTIAGGFEWFTSTEARDARVQANECEVAAKGTIPTIAAPPTPKHPDPLSVLLVGGVGSDYQIDAASFLAAATHGAKDDTRWYLNGVLIMPTSRLYSTNGHRALVVTPRLFTAREANLAPVVVQMDQRGIAFLFDRLERGVLGNYHVIVVGDRCAIARQVKGKHETVHVSTKPGTSATSTYPVALLDAYTTGAGADDWVDGIRTAFSPEYINDALSAARILERGITFQTSPTAGKNGEALLRWTADGYAAGVVMPLRETTTALRAFAATAAAAVSDADVARATAEA